MRSSVLLQQLRDEVEIDFAFRKAGKLVLYRSAADLVAAERSVLLKRSFGCQTTVLTMREARDIEPSLESMRSGYAGAVYSADDHLGDARLFSMRLADELRNRFGVRFRLGCEARGLLRAKGRISGVQLDDACARVRCGRRMSWRMESHFPRFPCSAISHSSRYAVTVSRCRGAGIHPRSVFPTWNIASFSVP